MNYTLEADVPYTIVDTAHPIMQGMTNFSIKDEAFYSMTWSKSPEIHVLATAAIDATPSAQADRTRRRSRAADLDLREAAGARRRPGSPIARSSGCRGTSTRTSRTRRFSRCCSAASPGRAAVGRHADDRTPRARRPRRHGPAARRRTRTGAQSAGRTGDSVVTWVGRIRERSRIADRNSVLNHECTNRIEKVSILRLVRQAGQGRVHPSQLGRPRTAGRDLRRPADHRHLQHLVGADAVQRRISASSPSTSSAACGKRAACRSSSR